MIRRNLLGKLARLMRLPADKRRRAAMRVAARVMRDDAGGEILEYALVAGLIVAGSVATIACVGTKVLTRWNSVNSSV